MIICYILMPIHVWCMLTCTFSHVSGSAGFRLRGSKPRSPGTAPGLIWLN